jgi:glycosyltransferase involved in cell wall biosynthesis
MPFAILEALGCGRPVCAIHLPQLECVIQEGLSGTLVSRSTNEDDMAERLSQAFLAVREDIRNGRLTPEGVASAIRDFTPERQLAKCYENHRQIQQRKFGSDVQNVSVRTGQDGETIGQP